MYQNLYKDMPSKHIKLKIIQNQDKISLMIFIPKIGEKNQETRWTT